MMKSSSQYAYAKTVTEDSNSNDTSFSYDDDDDSNEVDKVFQDHNFSLSQVAVNANVDGEDFEEDDENDGHQEGGTADPSYDDPDMDSELANNWDTILQTASPKKKKKTIWDHFRDESPGRRRLSYGTRIGVKDDDGSVYLGGQRGDRLFKPGETFLSSKKEYDGMAFTLSNMDCFDGDMIWKAECTAVWMRVEKTFISDAAADTLEQEWVLLKKHKDLPQWPVIIPLAELSARLPWKLEDSPNNMKSPPLCYKMEDDKTCSYYYERGNEVKWAPKKTSEGGPLAMDLFAGGGGASLGLQKAGWNVNYKLEWNEEASTTLDINFKGCKIFRDSIENFLKKMKTCHDKNMNMHPAPLEAIYIHGSPPCQGWSLVNTSGGVNDPQNNKCTMTFLNAVLHFQPKFVSMENVPGLLRKGLDVLRKVMAVLVANDYQVQLCELEATFYGDAQKRKRIILLASKKGWQLPSIPAATHGPGLLPKRTAKDAIGDLEKTEPTDTGRVHLDGGKEIYDHYRQGTELGRKLDKVTALDANEAAGTIRKQNPVMHYLKHRYITARERSR